MKRVIVLALAIITTLTLTGAEGGCKRETGDKPTKVGEQNDKMTNRWKLGKEEEIVKVTDPRKQIYNGIDDRRPPEARVVDPRKRRTVTLRVFLEPSFGPYQVRVSVTDEEFKATEKTSVGVKTVTGYWSAAGGLFETTVTYTSNVILFIALEGITTDKIGKATKGGYCYIIDGAETPMHSRRVKWSESLWKPRSCFVNWNTIQ